MTRKIKRRERRKRRKEMQQEWIGKKLAKQKYNEEKFLQLHKMGVRHKRKSKDRGRLQSRRVARENVLLGVQNWQSLLQITQKKPTVTVALPMYRSRTIAWLALESLARQKNVDFSWELLIAEEREAHAFGPRQIKKYIAQLEKAGCVSIQYLSLNKWMPLSQKWVLLAQRASETNCFILQAADNYSQPFRLKETRDIFLQRDVDWSHMTQGLFYDISSFSYARYDHRLWKWPTALKIAIQTSHMKRVPIYRQKRYVDGWLFRMIHKQCGRNFNVVINNTNNWNKGVFTHGANNITSWRSRKIQLGIAPMQKYSGDVEIPRDISNKLKKTSPLRLGRV